jgi:hypothetical protein
MPSRLPAYIQAALRKQPTARRLEDVPMTRPDIGGISPFFIVQDVAGAFAFFELKDSDGYVLFFGRPRS